MNIDFAKVQQQIEAGYIGVQKHPTADLLIYNYTQRAQFDNVWTDEILACRGLITDGRQNIVARPFPKFFNYDQLPKLPAEPFDVFEKLDGSLGILFTDPTTERPVIATRGSFASPQAIEATRMLQETYARCCWPRNLTLLLEIIYPGNRIVVNYGARRELVLLAVIDTQSGVEIPFDYLAHPGFPVVRRFDGLSDLSAITQMQQDNAEGFVIRFKSGLRVKIKFQEYKRLHKLLTGVTPRHIWDLLKDGKSIDELADRVPDEFFAWLRKVDTKIRGDFERIEQSCRKVFRSDFPTRKDAAEYFKQCEHPAVLFAMLDGHNYAQRIWKLIYPGPATAFRCGGES